MKTIFFALCLVLALPAIAQDAGSPPSAAASVTADAGPEVSAPEVAPTPSELVSGVLKVASDYKAGGALAAAAALLALLMQVTKVPVLRKLLDDKGREWVRPIIIVLIGGGTGAVSALQSGASVGASVVAGVMAGISGVGMREVMRHLSSDERDRVRVGLDAVTEACLALEKQLKANASPSGPEAVAAAEKQIAGLSVLPARSRLEGLSALLNPPKPA